MIPSVAVLPVVSERCRVAHDWRHVLCATFSTPERHVDTEGSIRADQDVIMCARCHTVSVAFRKVRA